MRKYHQSSIKGQHSADENGGAEADKVCRLTIIHTNICNQRESPSASGRKIRCVLRFQSLGWNAFYGIYCFIANANLYPILKCLISCKLTCIHFHSHSLSRKIQIYCSLNAQYLFNKLFVIFTFLRRSSLFYTSSGKYDNFRCKLNIVAVSK